MVGPAIFFQCINPIHIRGVDYKHHEFWKLTLFQQTLWLWKSLCGGYGGRSMVYSHGGARLRPMAQPSQSAFGTITYSMLYSLCRCTISAIHHSTHYNTAIHQSTILSQLCVHCISDIHSVYLKAVYLKAVYLQAMYFKALLCCF